MNRYVITVSRHSVTLRFYTSSSHASILLLYQYAKQGYKISLTYETPSVPLEFSAPCKLISEVVKRKYYSSKLSKRA